MALNIRIDLDNKYERILLDKECRGSTFESTLIDGTTVKLGIKISKDEDAEMADVYNLAFGPVDDNFKVDDKAKLAHQDHSKVFSTIVFAALSFLEEHKGKYIGIDGSNTARAYMYYRCIQNNYNYLNSLFNIYGVNFFLRVLHNGSLSCDPKDWLRLPKLILPGEQIQADKLYNYIIFTLKSSK